KILQTINQHHWEIFGDASQPATVGSLRSQSVLATLTYHFESWETLFKSSEHLSAMAVASVVSVARDVAVAGVSSTSFLFARDAGGYVGLDAGANFQQNLFIGLHEYYLYFPSGLRVKFDPGVRLDLKVGYELNRYLAVELDSGVIHNTSSSTFASRN